MTDSTSTADSHGAEAKPTAPLRIAIIGGGIVGVATALGLLRRGMEVRLYEQASSFREIGAGVAFTTNAQRCMERLSPDVLAAMKAVSTKNDNPYYTYVDGYRPEAGGAQLFQLHAGDTGFDACHRAHFLDGMVRHLPRGVVAFEKRFRSYARDEERDEFLVHFEDGSTATADAGEFGALLFFFFSFSALRSSSRHGSVETTWLTRPSTASSHPQSSAATASDPACARSSSAQTARPRTRDSRTRSATAAWST